MIALKGDLPHTIGLEPKTKSAIFLCCIRRDIHEIFSVLLAIAIFNTVISVSASMGQYTSLRSEHIFTPPSEDGYIIKHPFDHERSSLPASIQVSTGDTISPATRIH